MLQVESAEIHETKLRSEKVIKLVNQGYVQGLEELLKRFPSIDKKLRDKNGNSLVCIATCKGDLNMLKLLIHNHFDINIPNYEGNTPLHFGISLK